MELFLGRQPILGRRQQTVGYELLFRSGMTNAYDGTDEAIATSTVISNTFLAMGSPMVLGAKLGFLNFPRQTLLDDSALLLPPGKVVVEILETVEADESVVAACRRLKQSGYQVALDDVSSTGQGAPLWPYADYAKIDFRAIHGSERTRLGEHFRRQGLQLLAEKVETKADFDAALAGGFEFFQGYFFARPEIIRSKEVPSSKLACLRLLSELHRPELDFRRVETLIRGDVGLVKKLLAFVNSAAFPFRRHFVSILDGLVAIGEENIRRWAAMAAIPALARDKPGELVDSALIRARFCELAAAPAGVAESAANCFLVGLLSLLDAMIGRPMEELIAGLALDPSVPAAILAPPDRMRGAALLLELARSFERSEMEEVSRRAAAAGIGIGPASDLYLEAVRWTNALKLPRAETAR